MYNKVKAYLNAHHDKRMRIVQNSLSGITC